MKRGGGLHPARPDWWRQTKRSRATPGGLVPQRHERATPGGRASALTHVPSFGRNSRGSPGFLAYPFAKAYQWHRPGT